MTISVTAMAMLAAALAASACVSGSVAGPYADTALQAAYANPTRVAHRGGAGIAPENTMAAFRAGIDSGADALELDVRLSSDGRLVVMHDSTVKRTTNGTGRVSDMTLAELKALDAGSRFRGPSFGRQEIPTLDEVLDLVAGFSEREIGLQIEIKVLDDGSRYDGIEAELIRALESRSLVDSTIVISFDFPSLMSTKELEPGLRTCALIGNDYFKAAGKASSDAIATSLSELGVDYVGVYERRLDRGLFEALRRAGLGVGAWTVDSPKRMKELAVLGVDFITSNRPDVLKRVFP